MNETEATASMQLRIKCRSCHGTGIYVGFAEKDGRAVVCHTCHGSGAETITYTPFTKRVRRDGVKAVGLRNYGLYLHPGEDRGEVTYEEFLAGKMPTEDETLYERVTGKKEREEDA